MPATQMMVRLMLLIAIAISPSALHAQPASDAKSAIEKATLYIELVKGTERAAESWDRYRSWVNLKTGPTGKERYISYGMYDVHDVSGLLNEVRKVAPGMKPGTPQLDAVAKRYMESYEAVAPVLNRANAYYDSEGYKADGMSEGKKLHAEMMPLAEKFLAEREVMLRELRVFVRQTEQQELALIEAREGRSRAWHAANVLSAANRVVDLFPKERPTPMSSDMMDEMIKSIGPNTPGEKFEQIMSGVVPPQNVVIDMPKFDAALKNYAAAVEAFDGFVKQKPKEIDDDFKALPRHLLNALQALQQPLASNQGRDFEGSGPLVGRVVQGYFDLLNESNSVSTSQIRFLQ